MVSTQHLYSCTRLQKNILRIETAVVNIMKMIKFMLYKIAIRLEYVSLKRTANEIINTPILTFVRFSKIFGTFLFRLKNR